MKLTNRSFAPAGSKCCIDLDDLIFSLLHGIGTTMPQGKIKKIVSDKGFGFITQDGGASDLFFHMSAVQNAEFESLQEGERVSFDIGSGPKGPRAETVRVLED